MKETTSTTSTTSTTTGTTATTLDPKYEETTTLDPNCDTWTHCEYELPKVYCKNCKWLGWTDMSYRGYYCRKRIGQKDSPIRRYSLLINDFEKQNEDNDCKFYQRSWYKFWIK